MGSGGTGRTMADTVCALSHTRGISWRLPLRQPLSWCEWTVSTLWDSPCPWTSGRSDGEAGFMVAYPDRCTAHRQCPAMARVACHLPTPKATSLVDVYQVFPRTWKEFRGSHPPPVFQCVLCPSDLKQISDWTLKRRDHEKAGRKEQVEEALLVVVVVVVELNGGQVSLVAIRASLLRSPRNTCFPFGSLVSQLPTAAHCCDVYFMRPI